LLALAPVATTVRLVDASSVFAKISVFSTLVNILAFISDWIATHSIGALADVVANKVLADLTLESTGVGILSAFVDILAMTSVRFQFVAGWTQARVLSIMRQFVFASVRALMSSSCTLVDVFTRSVRASWSVSIFAFTSKTAFVISAFAATARVHESGTLICIDTGGSISVEMVSLATVALEAAVGINTSSVCASSIDQVALINIDWMSIRSG